MNPEVLPTKETKQTAEAAVLHVSESALTQDWILTNFTERTSALEQLKDRISLKSYYEILEKLNQEKETANSMLLTAIERQETLAEYSFILDPAYFEQQFFTPTLTGKTDIQ